MVFGPDPSSWLHSVYFMAVAITFGVIQLGFVWTIRNQAK